MHWTQALGLSYFAFSGLLLIGAGLLGVCSDRNFTYGALVLSVGAVASFAVLPRLGVVVRRRLFRAAIRLRRAAERAASASAAAVSLAVSDAVMARRVALLVGVVLVVYLASADLVAGTGPWEIAVNKLCQSFKTTLGKGLALVAVILGGLMFAFGEGGSKSAIAGLIFGAGMVLAAPDFLAWIGLAANC